MIYFYTSRSCCSCLAKKYLHRRQLLSHCLISLRLVRNLLLKSNWSMVMLFKTSVNVDPGICPAQVSYIKHVSLEQCVEVIFVFELTKNSVLHLSCCSDVWKNPLNIYKLKWNQSMHFKYFRFFKTTEPASSSSVSLCSYTSTAVAHIKTH